MFLDVGVGVDVVLVEGFCEVVFRCFAYFHASFVVAWVLDVMGLLMVGCCLGWWLNDCCLGFYCIARRVVRLFVA